jgi:hypothetical protein
MESRLRRALAVGARATAAVLLALFLLITASQRDAHGGGSVWNFDRETYQPGERASAWASVWWEFNPALGDLEDGPYNAFVAPEGLVLSDDQLIPGSAVWVSELRVALEPYDSGGLRFGPHHATIEFVVPDLPEGQYVVWHCNRDCTTTLGDITTGVLTIGPAPLPPPSPTDTAPPSSTSTTSTTSTAPTTSTASDTDAQLATSRLDGNPTSASPIAVAAGVLLLVITAVGAGTVIDHRRRRDE